ncbi:MAG: hypothetical protein ACKOCW_00225, partial [Planctomycetaceae bacterium]
AAARGGDRRRSEIGAAAAAAAFWDDPAAARERLAELYRLERVAEALTATAAEATRLGEAVSRIDRRGAAQRGETLAREIDHCQRRAALLRFAVLCDAPLRRRDALVAYETRDPAGRAHVESLVACHSAWARRLGYDVVTIHEEEGTPLAGQPAAQVVLHFAGAAAAGMLEAEDGFHEFADGRSADRLVKVTVMPVVAELDDVVTEVLVTSRDASGPSCRIRASQRRSGQAVVIRSRHPRADAEGHARELLAAEIARQERGGARPAPVGIVRRWWLGDNPDVRDPRTGVTLSRLKDVLDGQIEPFLLAHLERRVSDTPPDTGSRRDGFDPHGP